jgi:Ras-related protein Rab-12
MPSNIDYTFKILMIGSASVGKSSLSDRFISGVFDPDIKLTVGVEFYVKTIEVPDPNGEDKRWKIKLQIWDLGGETRFSFLLPTYCLGSSGAFFLFDLTRPSTLHTLDKWTDIVREKNGDIPILLIGNKKDLEENKKVTVETGEKTVEDYDYLSDYIEVSAKTGENVEKVFQKITEYMLKDALKSYY